MDELLIRQITEQVVKELHGIGEKEPVEQIQISGKKSIPVGISARHIHLTQEHLEVLFGRGQALEKQRDLPQPGEFVARQTVTLVGPSLRPIERVRILGDLRPITQVEISRSDAYLLGIAAKVRKSGDIAGTPGVTIIGPRGTLQLSEGVIIANRHIHMSPADAEHFGVKDGEEVDVRVVSEKPTILGKVQIRVKGGTVLYMHVDLDDANSAAMGKDQVYVEILSGEVSKCCWQV